MPEPITPHLRNLRIHDRSTLLAEVHSLMSEAVAGGTTTELASLLVENAVHPIDAARGPALIDTPTADLIGAIGNTHVAVCVFTAALTQARNYVTGEKARETIEGADHVAIARAYRAIGIFSRLLAEGTRRLVHDNIAAGAGGIRRPRRSSSD